MTGFHPSKDIGSAVAEGRGPIEAAMRAHAAAVRQRLRGFIPSPVVRVATPVEPAEVEPVVTSPATPGIATSKGRALVVAVAMANGLNWREIVGPSRTRRVVGPRNEVSFRLVTELGMSYPQAGRVLGGKDHTTILHGCRRHAETSPEAAEVWRKHVECETERRAHKRELAHRLHSQGLPVKAIAARLHVVPAVVSRWIS